MTITVDWGTKVINVPQVDLTPLGGSLYELPANAFRNTLKLLEASEAGAPFPPILRHSTESTLAGVTYARQLEIINGYTIDFQNTGTPYTVTVTGANHNLSDVTNFDGGMSMIIGNSAGLIVVEVGAVSISNTDIQLIANTVWGVTDSTGNTTIQLLGQAANTNIVASINAAAVWAQTNPLFGNTYGNMVQITTNNAINTLKTGEFLALG